MTLNTSDINNNPVVSNKKENYKKLRQFHEETFEKLGCPDAFFLGKLAYKEKGPTAPDEKIVALFASEMLKGDVYLEFADSENIPQDPERRLYKWRYNSNYHQEYVSMVSTGGTIRYLIPVVELILIQNNPAETKVEETTTLSISESLSDIDLPLKDATVLDLAAIMWRRPISKKQWINNLIQQ